MAMSADLQGGAQQPALTFVVGLVGPSCSGKSTAVTELSAALNGTDSHAQAIRQDHFFKFDQYKTDACPSTDFGGHTWKNWETQDSIDWPAFVGAIERAKAESASPYLVVEGFQLCARPEMLSLLDAVVALGLPKAACWQRRKDRALSMRSLPPGLGDDMNYEVLETYTLGATPEAKSAAQEALRAAAAASAACAEEGDDAWLRLYFEELVWPEAERQREDLARVEGVPVLELDACEPAGQEEWLRERMPEAAAFVHRVLPAP